eukprot:scaffold259009_cov15-Tisochrysis_lutea.AAC.1
MLYSKRNDFLHLSFCAKKTHINMSSHRTLQAAPFAAARNLGLNLLNAAAPLRTSVMRIAMGL